MSARLPHWVGVLSAVLLVAGCQTHHPPAPHPQSPPTTISTAQHIAPSPPPQEVVSNSPSGGAVPEALSQKTAAFARSMETPAAPPAPPSAVKWGATPSAASGVPSAGVNAPTSLSLDSSAALHTKPSHVANKADSSDEPKILPESSDFTDTPGSTAGVTKPLSTPAGAADSLEAEIDRRMREAPQDTAVQLDYQLLEMLRNGSGAELAALSSASSEDREVIAALIDGLSNFRTGVRQDSNMLLSAKIKPLLDMSDRLRSLAELSVDTAVLCRQVKGFGRYDTMDSRFRAGRENPTIVYCEISNFASRQNANAEWESKLTQQVSIYTEVGMLVWKDRAREVVDTCRERRHDFYSYDMVHLPANLTIGRYILKVTIVDRLANRVAEKTLPVDIVADPSDATASSDHPATP